jgi:hypothetical protein
MFTSGVSRIIVNMHSQGMPQTTCPRQMPLVLCGNKRVKKTVPQVSFEHKVVTTLIVNHISN